MRIEIYGKTSCPYCNMAKRLAARICSESSQQNHTYIYYQLDRDFNREELLNKFPGARTFPQIMVDNKIIGGYQEFEEWYGD